MGVQMKELTVFAKDRVGLLADLTKILGEKGINIEYLYSETVGTYAVLHLMVDSEDLAAHTLEREGFTVVRFDMLVVELPNKPGAIAGLAGKLAEAEIDIKCSYFLQRSKSKGLFALRVDKMEDAKRILKGYAVKG